MTTDAPRTLIRLALRNAQEAPRGIALREKDRGIWKEVTWAAYADEVLALAAGLDALGVMPGDAMMVLGDNRARLYMATVAAATLRVYPMPTYPSATLDELQHFAGEVRISVAVAEDQEQVDKVMELRAAGAQIDHVIYDDPRGLVGHDAPGLMSWEDVIARGTQRLAREPGLRADLVARSGPEDPAVFLHSSGTTGKPKGIVLSQRNVIAAAENGKAAGMFATGEELLAYLPMAWVGDYELAVGAALTHRFTVNVPERAETVLRDLREIAPTLYLAAPRSWDSILTTIQVGIENSSRLKRAVYHAFMDRAVAAERARLQGTAKDGLSWPVRVLGEALVFGPIKDQFGLSRVAHAFTGGEAMGEDTFLFFRALGIKLRELYGQTENSGMNAVQSATEVQLHTVGRPLPGVEIRVAEDGEILLRGDSVFAGYHDNPKATAETLRDGWLHTGDAGFLNADGHLVVLGRVSEVVYTAGGERYVPNYIENRLKFSPYIQDAAVIGSGRDALTAMVCIDFDSVGHWAEVNRVPYVSYADLSQRPEVATLIRQAFARINPDLPEALRLHRFVCLHKAFDPDDGEITRTRKLRRKVVEERYSGVIDALYSGARDVHVQAVVTYETGEAGTVDRTLKIEEV